MIQQEEIIYFFPVIDGEIQNKKVLTLLAIDLLLLVVFLCLVKKESSGK